MSGWPPTFRLGSVRYGSVTGVSLAVSLMKPSTLFTPAVVPLIVCVIRLTAGCRLLSQPNQAECAMSM